MSNSLIQNNGKFIQSNGKWIGNKMRYVYTTAENGVVYASPSSCYKDTEITLTNEPNEGYVLENYSITGATLYDTNKVKMGYENINVSANFKMDYNPLNLPPYTIRLKFLDDITPTFTRGTATQISTSPNIWDLNYENDNWNNLCQANGNLLEVMGANTTNVTSMASMFERCSALSSVKLFDTSMVNNMYQMFQNNKISSIPYFDTSNVSSMQGTFSGCSSLSSVPLFNTSKVVNMNTMFSRCISLSSVPLFDTSNVEKMAQTFYACHSLRTIPLFNMTSLTALGLTFYNCSSLSSVPLFDTSNIVLFNETFEYCNSLTSIPLFNTTNAQRFNYVFKDCINVKNGALALYNQLTAQSNPPTAHVAAFRNCGSNTTQGASELAQIPSDWK